MARDKWKATGRLQPIWDRFGDPADLAKRDKLAAAIGTTGTALSRINSGASDLTRKMAMRIIAVMPEVTLADLGAPEEAAEDDPRSRPVLDRLEALEAAHKKLRCDLDDALREATRRLAALEAALARQGRRSGRGS